MTLPLARTSIVAAVLATAVIAPRAQQWSPPVPKNLQVLPKDTAPGAVVQTMRGFAMGLGVRCQNCHVFTGANPNDLSTFDFASDEKPAKKTARTMLRMVMAINTEHLKGVGEPAAPGQLKVTCYTCHRGQAKPLTAPPGGG